MQSWFFIAFFANIRTVISAEATPGDAELFLHGAQFCYEMLPALDLIDCSLNITLDCKFIMSIQSKLQ